MKVLVIASLASSLINFRLELVKSLIQKGYDVHAAAPNLEDDQSTVSKLETLGVKVHSIPLGRTGLNPFADLWALFSLYRLMRKIKPNTTLGYTVKPVIYGSIAAFLARAPNRVALITGLGYVFEQDGKSGRITRTIKAASKILYKVAMAATHKVIFQNPDDRALFLSEKLINDPHKAFVVNGSGVDVQSFSVAKFPIERSFLMIGRYLGAKGIREYAAAAKILKSQYPEWHFKLVGWLDAGPDCISKAELSSWVNAGYLDDLGKLDDVRPALANCSVYVLPSYREGTPRTVLEAMAMGRPIITTDVPGCRETVVEGVNGFMVQPKDVPSLSVAMERYILEPNLIEEMGRKGRELVEVKYDVHKVNLEMLRIVRL